MPTRWNGETFEESTGFNPSLYKDPFGFTAKAATGVVAGGGKLVYDAAALGVDTGNYLVDEGLVDFEAVFDPLLGGGEITLENPHRLNLGKDYWDALESINADYKNIDPTVEGFANLTALLSTTRAVASNLANYGKFATLLNSTSRLKQLGGAIAVGSVAEVPASLIHTRSSDGSFFELVPPEYQNDFTRWFIDRTEDSEVEGRFKNALEGMVIGAGFEGVLTGVSSLFRTARKAAHASIPAANNKELLEAADSILGDGTGALTNTYLKENTLVGNVMKDEVGIFRDNIIPRADDGMELWRLNQKSLHRFADEQAKAAKKAARQTRRAPKSKKARKRNALDRAAEAHRRSVNTPDLDVQYIPRTLEDIGEEIIPKSVHEAAGYLNSKETVPTAAAYRNIVKDYDAGQIQEGLPVRDAFKSNVPVADEVQAKQLTSIFSTDTKAVLDEADRILLDPKASPDDKLFAKGLKDDFAVNSNTRLNPNTSGDSAIDGGVRLANSLSKFSNLQVKEIPSRGRLQTLIDAHRRFRSGELGIGIEKMSKEMGYSLEGLRIQAANMSVALGNSEDIMVLFRQYRHDLAQQVQKTANSIDLTKEIKTNPQFIQLMREISLLDEADHSIQGSIGSVGRMLNFQQLNPSDMGKMLNEVHQTIKTDIEKATGIVKSSDRKEALKRLKDQESTIKSLYKSIDDPDEAPLRSLVRNLQKGAAEDPEAVAKALQAPRTIEYIRSTVLGGMLSAPRTLTGSVLMGGATQTIWKQFGVRTVEGILGSLFARRTGARIGDVALAAAVGVKQSWRAVENFFAGKNKKTMEALYDLSYRTREGVENPNQTFREIRESHKQTALMYHEKGMYKSESFINLISYPLATANRFVNIFTSRIKGVDDYFKGINREIVMEVEAKRAWYREGADALFGGKISQEDFITKYKGLQKGVIELQAKQLPALEFAQQIDRLFDGNKVLADKVINSIKSAEHVGREVTLQQSTKDTFGGDMIRAIAKNAGGESNIGVVAQLAVIPFQKTPVNMLREVVEHTPLAVTARSFRKAMESGSPEDKLRVLSKMTAGTVLAGTAAYAATSERIQGTINPNDRNRYLATGRTPHSILIGDTWYSYQKLGPVATFLSTGADMYTGLQKDGPDSGFAAMRLGQAFAIAAEESHLRIVSDLLDLSNSEKVAEDITTFTLDRVNNLIVPASGFVKAMGELDDRSKYRTSVDKEVKDLDGFIRFSMANAAKNNVLFRLGTNAFGSGLYEQDVTVMGDDMYKYGEGTHNRLLHLLGVGNTDRSKDPAIAHAFAYGLIPGTASGHSIEGAKLTANEFKNYQKFRYHGVDGQGIDELNDLVNSQEYLNLSDHFRKQHLRAAMDLRDKYFKNLLLDADPELQRRKYQNELFKLNEMLFHEPDRGTEDFYLNSRRKNIESKENSRFNQQFKEGLEQLGIFTDDEEE